MNVSLTPQLEAMVRQKVETGLYSNASEVVREALRLLEERERVTRLRAAIAVGIEQIERGEGVAWYPGMMDDLIREADEADRQGLPIRDEVLP